MRPDTIVAYSYRADIYCPQHTVEQVMIDREVPNSVRQSLVSMTEESALDFLAETYGIDREDERSFDSGDFPKVVFYDSAADQVYQGFPEHCASCGRRIVPE